MQVWFSILGYLLLSKNTMTDDSSYKHTIETKVRMLIMVAKERRDQCESCSRGWKLYACNKYMLITGMLITGVVCYSNCLCLPSFLRA